MVLYLPRQQPLQWRLCSSCVTHHNSKSNLIGPKLQLALSLCIPAVCQFLPLSFPLLSLPLCLSQSLLPLSVSLCISLSVCFFFHYIWVTLLVTAIQTQEEKNPLNVQPNSWKMRKRLLYTWKLQTVKCSYAKMSSNVSHLYCCTEEICTDCNRKHSSYAFHVELKGEKKGFCRQLNGYFYFPLISNTIVFGCCTGDFQVLVWQKCI